MIINNVEQRGVDLMEELHLFEGVYIYIMYLYVCTYVYYMI